MYISGFIAINSSSTAWNLFMCSFCTRLIDSMPPPMAIRASLPVTVAGTTIDRQCASGLAVDGGAGDCNWEAGADRALAGDVHHHGALLHGAAHHHVLDLAGRDAGALHGF